MVFLGVVIIFLDQPCEKNRRHYVKYVNRKVLIDDFFVVASFREGSLNCLLFDYFDSNQNRKIEKKELEDNVFKNRDVVFCKILDNMGFKSDIKKTLFTTGSDYIIYHPDRIHSKNNIKVN